jgi:hypothetical protein
MRAPTVVSLLLAAALPACNGIKIAPKAEWREVTSTGSKVSALFPGKPVETPTESGTQNVLEVMNGQAAYLLMVSGFKDKTDLGNKDDVKRILDGTRQALVKDLKGFLRSEKDDKFGEYPGRSIDVLSPDGLYRTRIYLTETKLIQIVVLGPKKFSDGEDARKFLESLKIDE